MNIAIAVDGDSMASPVSTQFELCSSLLIVNADTMNVTVIANSEAPEQIAGQHLAQAVLLHKCEGVITGLIRPTAFEIMVKAGVTRFLGTGHDAAKALELMHAHSLELVRDADGGKGCGSSHHHH